MGKSLLGESILFVSIWCFPFVWRYTRRCFDCPIALCRRESKCSSCCKLAACKSPARWEYCSWGEKGERKRRRILMRAACQQSWLHWTWWGKKCRQWDKVFSQWKMTKTNWRPSGQRLVLVCGRLQSESWCVWLVTLATWLTAPRIGRQSNIKLPYCCEAMLSLYHRPLLRPHIMK